MVPEQALPAPGHPIAVLGAPTGKTMYTLIAKGMYTDRRGIRGSKGLMETGQRASSRSAHKPELHQRKEPVQLLSGHVQQLPGQQQGVQAQPARAEQVAVVLAAPP